MEQLERCEFKIGKQFIGGLRLQKNESLEIQSSQVWNAVQKAICETTS